jgi:hypothetical protein
MDVFSVDRWDGMGFGPSTSRAAPGGVTFLLPLYCRVDAKQTAARMKGGQELLTATSLDKVFRLISPSSGFKLAPVVRVIVSLSIRRTAPPSGGAIYFVGFPDRDLDIGV